MGIQVMKDYAVNLKFNHTKTDFKELQIMSYSPQLSPYRMYVAKNSMPSSQNSIQIIPTWLSGYTADIIRGSKDACEGTCQYNILIESESSFAEVYLLIKYEDSVTKVDPLFPVFSYVRPYGTHCYSIAIDQSNKDDSIIIQTNLFSGSVKIYINPWTKPADKSKFWFEDNIYSEKVIQVTPQDRKGNSTTETGDLYICIEGQYATSYMLKIYPESKSELLQRYNFLNNDIPIRGYLTPNLTTSYRVIEFTGDKDIDIDMFSFRGSPMLYAYVCEEIRSCQYSKERIEKESKIIFLKF